MPETAKGIEQLASELRLLLVGQPLPECIAALQTVLNDYLCQATDTPEDAQRALATVMRAMVENLPLRYPTIKAGRAHVVVKGAGDA